LVNKKIILILVLIVSLPALFYTAYELSELNESEVILTRIHNQKLNSIVFSINQYSWDWYNKIKFKFLQDVYQKGDIKQPASFVMQSTAGLDAVFISDSLFTDFRFIQKTNTAPLLDRNLVLDTLKAERNIIKRLYHRRSVGYAKIEPLLFASGRDSRVLLLMFIIEEGEFSGSIAGLFFNAENITDNILSARLSSFSDQEVIIGLFEQDIEEPVISTGAISLSTAAITKKLWLFPNHLLGIMSEQGSTIRDLMRNRLQRSILLISLLCLVLVFSAVILYKNVYREMELAKMKSDFVSNVSHELRTPLALIRMFSETLEMDRVPTEKKRREYYKIISKETIRLTHLINNILDFSKMEADKKQFHFREIDLNEIVEQCLSLYKFHIEEKGFQLKVILNSKPLFVNADKEALIESLINLLENSIKYSRKRKHVTVSTGAVNGQAFIQVKDQGIGISPKDQERIFEKFYRVADGLVHDTKGSGLGLSLVNFIIKAHGGSVQVKSALGSGSSFRLVLPVIEKKATN